MITINLDESINGYRVDIHDWKESHTHKEDTERRIDALQIILNFVKEECEKEVKLIQDGGKFNAS